MRKAVATVSILVLLAMVASIAGAAAPDQPWEALLNDAAPIAVDGATVTLVGTDADASPDYSNVYPHQAWTSAQGVDFEPPPVSVFYVGQGEHWSNAYFYLLNHDLTGMAVVHIWINQSGGQHWYYVQNVPDFFGSQGQEWRFSVYWTAVPDMPATWHYLPRYIPYDGDGYPFGPNAHYGFVINP
jgi:hypothetical protein